MLIDSKTKIIATIGPASQNKDVLRQLFLAGVDVCRLNFSHSRHEEHLEIINTILELNKELNTNIAILADLQGPKIRTGEVENNSVLLKKDNIVTFTTQYCIGTENQLYISYDDFARDARKGDIILIDDGKIKLVVEETDEKTNVIAKIIHGGIVSSKKGINLPDTKISIPSLTEKDRKDLDFILSQDIDWVALSFVRDVNDIIELKDIIKKSKKNIKVIAKIEKPEAIKNINDIIEISDGIMVARGDLGVEISFNEVPALQKIIIEKCINHNKPVIVATQMMESMITNFRPSRAEASDVANAVFDEADALMLSGETSVGEYPIEVIKSMQSIINYCEKSPYIRKAKSKPDLKSPSFLSDSICYNACKMANQTNAKVIVSITNNLNTTYRISGNRPKANIIVFTDNKAFLKQISLIWGVRGYVLEKTDNDNNIEDAIKFSIEKLKQKGIIEKENIVVHICSVPTDTREPANMIKITYVK